jgi:hypothetical protein
MKRRVSKAHDPVRVTGDETGLVFGVSRGELAAHNGYGISGRFAACGPSGTANDRSSPD